MAKFSIVRKLLDWLGDISTVQGLPSQTASLWKWGKRAAVGLAALYAWLGGLRWEIQIPLALAVLVLGLIGTRLGLDIYARRTTASPPITSITKRLSQLEDYAVHTLLPAVLGQPPWESGNTFLRSVVRWQSDLLAVFRESGYAQAATALSAISVSVADPKRAVEEGLQYLDTVRSGQPLSRLDSVSVRSTGFPQVIMRRDSTMPRFILLPNVEVANDSDRSVSVSFELMIDLKNTSVSYAAIGEPLDQWETVKHFQLVEHLNPQLPVPLDLASGQSRRGYLSFSYTGIYFVDTPTAQMFQINVAELDRPIQQMKLRLTELHTQKQREFQVGTIDIRELVI